MFPIVRVAGTYENIGWGIQIVPTTSNLVVVRRFEGSELFLPITPTTKIIGVDHNNKYVVIKVDCNTGSKLQYTVLLDCTS